MHPLTHVRRSAISACAFAAFSFAAINSPAQSASNEFWQAQNIYQIITDRYYDGDPANNNAEGNYNPTGNSVHGGDFKGLEQKLDYIKALGVTAIWISPVVKNANGEFHGYAGQDFYQVAPHWGTLANLQHMIQEAHARGILVINDIIVNHGGDLIYSTDAGYSSFKAPPDGYNLRYRNGSKQFAAPFNTNAVNPNLTNIFHNNGSIPDYNTAQHVELGELSGLDDFRTESPYVRSNMAAVYNYWIAQGFDGFRIDTVKHVEMGFWQVWSPVVHAYAATNGKPNFFMFGEVFDGSDSKCGSYTGTQGGGAFKIDSVVDYPLYFKMGSVFATASGNTKQIEDRYSALAANYDPAAQDRLVTFLDNHDNARFLNIGGATATRLNVALTFLYTSRGVPCLYYGTEQAFNGGNDPYDREDMFDGQFEQGPSLGDNFNMTYPQFLHVAKLNNFRRLYPALQTGTHVNKWSNSSGPGLFAYARRLGTQEVFVVFNTAGSTQSLPNRTTIFPPGTAVVNLFDTNEILTVTALSEIPSVTVPTMSAKIFVAQSDWRPLDPVVVSNSPAHDSTTAPTPAPIVLQFSKPMDTNSVQNSFRTTPVVSGAFSWSAAGDTMTFTPAGTGFPTLTMVTVRVTNAVDAVSGNAMFAPYELKYKTSTITVVDTTAPVVTLQLPTNNAVVAGNLTISGTATDNIAVQKVEVRLDSGPWVTASGTGAWSYNLNSSNFLNGPHQIAARATDSSNNLSPTNSVTVRFFNIPGSYVQRMTGGNASDATDCSANIWLHDTAYSFGSFGYTNGAMGYVGNAIAGICASAQPIYQRERYSTSSGGFYYQFDCPAGIYETTLLESETYWSAAGQRVFNVFIQGQQVLTNFDIFVAAGGINLPLTRVFTNAVTNAQLKILFTPVVDNARASGVQVRKIADVFSDTDGIPDWWRLGWFGHALGQAGDNSRGSDDADGDGASNLKEFLAGTAPIDPASIFKITNVAVTNGIDVQVSCSTVINHTYQLQSSAGLGAAAVWTDIGSPASGTGSVLVLTNTSGATDAARYYRVQAQ
ncbi:MAG: alpha-amylase family glycosyl hydrolase [Verrucomicrobiales bacterium]|nr:alpha-amylase family glycosyl hydrolase [Verrucomicrobiales bacterium]